jgi:hypothetical protein
MTGFDWSDCSFCPIKKYSSGQVWPVHRGCLLFLCTTSRGPFSHIIWFSFSTVLWNRSFYMFLKSIGYQFWYLWFVKGSVLSHFRICISYGIYDTDHCIWLIYLNKFIIQGIALYTISFWIGEEHWQISWFYANFYTLL